MFSQSLAITALILLSGAVNAVPVEFEAPVPECDLYQVRKWGYVVTQPQWTANSTGDLLGCAPKQDLFKRQDQTYDSTAELASDKTTYVWIGDNNPFPRAFESVWNRYAEACGDTFCDGTREVSELSGHPDGDRVVLRADGTFSTREIRDNYFTLANQAFFRAVTSTNIDDSGIFTQYEGPGFIHVTSTFGPAVGSSVTIRITNETPDQSLQCPAAVNLINGLGALVPELGAIFGFAGAICGAGF